MAGSAEERRCPGCGRVVPAGHDLCVKCGTRIAGTAPPAAPSTAGREGIAWAAAGLAALLLVGLVVIAFRECRRRGEEPPRAPGPTLSAAGDRGPETPGRVAADAAAPRRAVPDAAAPLPPDAGLVFVPGPPDAGATAGGIGTVRACVDARRAEAERACAIYRPGSPTAESVCLLGKLGATYWTCLKGHAFAAGRCLTRCLDRGRTCSQTCQSETGGSTAGCLLRCFRAEVDPCVADCLRP